MKLFYFALLLGLVACTTGCPKYRPSVDFNNPDSFIGKLNTHIKTEQDRYNCYRLGQQYTAKGCSGNPGSFPEGPALAKRIRNDLLETALPYIDSAYIDFVTDIQAGRDRNNFTLDLVELGTAASVGITNGERPLQIIGVALTAFRGGRRALDANFYKDQSTPILISKMDGNRARVRATILSRESANIDDYPLGAALSDIVDYYNAGTLVRAFTQLQQDTALITKQSEEDVLVLKGVPLSRPATEEETKEAQDALPVLENLSKSLSSVDPSVKASAVKKLQTIVSVLEKDPAVAPLLKVAEIASSETDGVKLLNGLKKVKRSQPTDSDVDRKVNRAINTNGK